MGEDKRRRVAGTTDEHRPIVGFRLDHLWTGVSDAMRARADAGDDRSARCIEAAQAAMAEIDAGRGKCAGCGVALRVYEDMTACSVAHLDDLSIGMPLCRTCASSPEALSAKAKIAVHQVTSGGNDMPPGTRVN